MNSLSWLFPASHSPPSQALQPLRCPNSWSLSHQGLSFRHSWASGEPQRGFPGAEVRWPSSGFGRSPRWWVQLSGAGLPGLVLRGGCSLR